MNRHVLRTNLRSVSSIPIVVCVLAMVGVVSISPRVRAVPASPHPVRVTQPDGTQITLRIHGDEYFHWYEDENGFTVVEDNGAYKFAALDASGRLVPTTIEVGKSDPKQAGIDSRVLPPADVIAAIRRQALPEIAGKDGPQLAPPSTGTVKNVVILMRFANHTSRTLPSNANYDTLFNAVGGDPTYAPTGSVRDVYLENSYGQLTINSTVFGWVDLPNTEQYYANGTSGRDSTIWQAITAALNAADPLIDFSQFDDDGDGMVDAIAFIHSGYGAEWGGPDADGTAQADRIWSHRWSIPLWTSAEGVSVRNYHINPGLWGISGSAIGRIGVISHETGHFFGLPDLYDTDAGGEGIGSYGMMANSWGFDGSQLHPPHFCAYNKIALNWLTPTAIGPGTHFAPQVAFNQSVFRVAAGFPAGEYLLIENRQPVGIESDLPQGGLCIWHIDEDKCCNTDEGYPGQAGWPDNNLHYRVALLQADGNFNLEKGDNRGDAGDVYRAGGVSMIGETTTPNTDSYQNGVITTSGITISDISAAGSTMTFTLSGMTADCNQNTIEDAIDIANGTSLDCNGNGVPDECDLGTGESGDCNANGIPDECDISTGVSVDCDLNGVPDECGGTFVYAASPNIAIADGNMFGGPGSPATHTINVPDSRTIRDIDVDLTINHTRLGDLGVVITHNGTSVTVVYRPGYSGSGTGCGADNFSDILLDDEGDGGDIWSQCSSNLSSPPNYTPEQALSAFDGMDAMGDWTIAVQDHWINETGTLVSWSVHVTELTVSEPCDCNTNGVPDDQDISGGTSADCNGNGVPDECEQDCDGDGIPDDCEIEDCAGDPACGDCNGNGVPDGCDINGDASADCNGNGVPDVCDIIGCAGDPACGDCNGNAVPDACDLAACAGDPACGDCNGNSIPDSCDIARCAGDPACGDCNGNAVPDACDLAGCAGDAACGDCDGNSILDSCDIADCTGDPACGDCNANGTPDACDITDCVGDAACDDCDANGIPDACDLSGCAGDPACGDCNGNSILDSCDIADCAGDPACGDCNANGSPDACDLAGCAGDPACGDCNGNAILDSCDIAGCTGDPACGDCNVNGAPDACDITNCVGDTACDDCNANGIPDACDLSGCVGDPACGDCNGNSILDSCDIAGCAGDPACGDCNGNAILDSCDITDCAGDPACGDCNANGAPDACDINNCVGDTACDDCDANGIPDACDLSACAGNPACGDCNGNAVLDACDIGGCAGDPDCGDCDLNGVPDACDISGCAGDPACGDCNANAVPDSCDISDCLGDPACDDCNGNAVPDACEPDCDADGVLDECEIADCVPGDPSCQDCNSNGIPDFCDVAECAGSLCCGDCDSNGVPDQCDPDLDEDCTPDVCDLDVDGDTVSNDTDNCPLRPNGPAQTGIPGVGNQDDEDGDGVGDACDICPGFDDTVDTNGNGVPDGCDCLALAAPSGEAVPVVRNRYLAFAEANAGEQVSLRVTFVDLPPPHDVLNGTSMWVGASRQVSELGGVNDASPPTFTAAPLQCDPFHDDWGTIGTVHIYGEAIVPGGLYEIQAIESTCDIAIEDNYSAALVLGTGVWGDVVGPFDAGAGGWTDADDSVDVATDVVAVLDKFGSLSGSPAKARADVEPATPDQKINITDVTVILDAFAGAGYPFAAPVPCQ